MNDSEAEILFIDNRFAPILEALDGQIENVRELIYIGDGPTPDGMHGYEQLIDEHDSVNDAGRGYDELAGLFYTDGTTGRSKGVMLSHQNLVCNSYNVIPGFGYGSGMRWLHAAPMFHIADALAIFGVTMVSGSHYFIPGFTPTISCRPSRRTGLPTPCWCRSW